MDIGRGPPTILVFDSGEVAAGVVASGAIQSVKRAESRIRFIVDPLRAARLETGAEVATEVPFSPLIVSPPSSSSSSPSAFLTVSTVSSFATSSLMSGSTGFSLPQPPNKLLGLHPPPSRLVIRPFEELEDSLEVEDEDP